jgi:hypothetical protein
MGGDVLNIPDDCCEMIGIKCTQDGHVTKIHWSHQELSGSIPSEIGNLANLEDL